MKLAIIGCTESTKKFIVEILKNPELEIVGIFTLEDEFSYKKSRFVKLDDLAKENNIKLYKLDKIDDPKIISLIKSLNPDLILESGWSQIIPLEILNIPSKGCIGIHCSFLPKNQGVASLNWALINGEKEWGVTLFYLKEKLDQGDIIDQKKFEIRYDDDIKDLFDKSDLLACDMLRINLPLIKEGNAPRKKQNKEEATYLPGRKPEDGKIDWSKSYKEIYNLIRGITKPYPGAFTFYNGKKMIIWESLKIEGDIGKPGIITHIMGSEGILVGTGSGFILIKSAKFENDSDMEIDELVKKYNLKESEKFE